MFISVTGRAAAVGALWNGYVHRETGKLGKAKTCSCPTKAIRKREVEITRQITSREVMVRNHQPWRSTVSVFYVTDHTTEVLLDVNQLCLPLASRLGENTQVINAIVMFWRNMLHPSLHVYHRVPHKMKYSHLRSPTRHFQKAADELFITIFAVLDLGGHGPPTLTPTLLTHVF